MFSIILYQQISDRKTIMPDVKVSYSLDFEFPHDIENIAREQGENPDTKVAIVQEFKDLIYERGECSPHRMDDDFLIKFLRARFWKVDNAYKLVMMKRFQKLIFK